MYLSFRNFTASLMIPLYHQNQNPWSKERTGRFKNSLFLSNILLFIQFFFLLVYRDTIVLNVSPASFVVGTPRVFVTRRSAFCKTTWSVSHRASYLCTFINNRLLVLSILYATALPLKLEPSYEWRQDVQVKLLQVLVLLPRGC